MAVDWLAVPEKHQTRNWSRYYLAAAVAAHPRRLSSRHEPSRFCCAFFVACFRGHVAAFALFRQLAGRRSCPAPAHHPLRRSLSSVRCAEAWVYSPVAADQSDGSPRKMRWRLWIRSSLTLRPFAWRVYRIAPDARSMSCLTRIIMVITPGGNGIFKAAAKTIVAHENVPKLTTRACGKGWYFGPTSFCRCHVP